MHVLIRQLRFEHRGPHTGFSLDVPALEVAAGERVALLGPSGCGKTTLLSLIAGIDVCQAGTVQVLGQAIHSMSDAERRSFRLQNLGLVFQRFELMPYLRLKENVLVPAFINGAARKEGLFRRAGQLLEEVGLQSRMTSFPGQLSQGELQRLAICRALINDPAILLADEPTASLDAASKQDAMAVMMKQVKTRGMTLMVATHDQQILEGFDRVIDLAAIGPPTIAAGERR